MKSIPGKMLIILLVIFGLSCKNVSLIKTISPSQTPSPEAKSTVPLPTATPQPTKETTPTQTPTVTPTNEVDFLGEMRVSVPGGAFSVIPPLSENFNYYYDYVTVTDESNSYAIQIVGVPFSKDSSTPDQIVDEYISALARSSKGNLQRENTTKIMVDKYDGFVYDISGEMANIQVNGQAFIVMPGENQYIFGFGILKLTYPDLSWKEKGRPAFNDLIDSILIVESSNLPDCDASTDPTYGYSKENPIKVGGMAFWGPSREITYMENLLGLNSEKLSYERSGSENYGDTILDVYEISGLGDKIVIYIDEYSYSDLYAPSGLTCGGPFLLEKP